MYESKKWGFELELKPLPIMPNQITFFFIPTPEIVATTGLEVVII